MARLAVLGHPVAHSRSPQMQSAALAQLGLGEEWSYEAIDVAPEDFEAQVRTMAAADFAGANVTVPHKRAALALADAPSEVAREIGAANTLVFAAGGIGAHNTDADGFLAALPGPAGGKRALVLGAGGAARAVLWALGREGATVDVWNRTRRRAEELCAELGGSPVAEPEAGDYELVVNTSAAGLGGGDPFADLPLPPDDFRAGQIVVDMVYGDAPSPLLRAAEAAGATPVDGIEVLVQQGALSLRIWTGREPPIAAMRAAART
ncbi:MAG TPA: shikimate dehydrogenase [Solirubrobacterales bacterium]|nr:shikimate dehydrogenase [Solirubrobacterales bacterium]